MLHTQRLHNSQMETRDEFPGVGVLDIMFGIALVVQTGDGYALRVMPTTSDIAATLAQVFPSAAAWEYLGASYERHPHGVSHEV